MPRGVVAAYQASKTGVNVTTATTGDPVNFHQTPNSGKTYVLVKNTHATTAYNVTIHVRATVEGQNVPEIITSIPALQEWLFGPFDNVNYGDDLWIDVANASLTFRVFTG